MAWLDEAIEHLTQQPVCGYQRDEAPMVEPTALAALALLAAGRNRYARPALDWLATRAVGRRQPGDRRRHA